MFRFASLLAVILLFGFSCNGVAAGDAACASTDQSGTCVPTPTKTRDSDHQALLALFKAMGSPNVTMIDWGNKDPCVGDATTPNAVGFAFWKGVACQPCNDDPTLYCVRSIWLHQKLLLGTIPRAFSGLTDLEILLMSANNITGPLEPGIIASFPNLRHLDLSYNQITGTLPLGDLARLHDLKSAKFDNNHLDGIDSPPPPFRGGFENLKILNINYNRNLTSPFPAAIAYMPKLDDVKIHDTAIYGPVPTDERAFYTADMLLLSGSSVCGDLPPACTRAVPGKLKPIFCDVDSLPDCNPLDWVAPPIRLGTANRNFGNVSLQVYKETLEQNLAIEVEDVTDLKHAAMYPLFVEMPRTKKTIDIVVASDLPFNHGQFLEGHHDKFFVVGTTYEAQMINIVVSSTAKPSTLSQLSAAAKGYSEKIIYTFDYLACPVCKGFAEEWRDAYFPGFEVKVLERTELEELSAKKTELGGSHLDEFIVVSWIPHGYNAEFEMKTLDMQELKLKYMNQGKAMVRKDAAWKLGKRGVSLLAAVTVPTADVEIMDFNSTKGGMTPAETAREWIRQHQQTVDMWSW